MRRGTDLGSKAPPVYLKVKLINNKTKQLRNVRALLDTGNTVKAAAAMSAKLADALGVPYTPHSLTCGTAGEGQTVQVKGLARKLTIAISPKTIVTLDRIIIIEGLNGELNLGAHFLQVTGASISFSKQGPATLEIERETIPLIASMKVCENLDPQPNAAHSIVGNSHDSSESEKVHSHAPVTRKRKPVPPKPIVTPFPFPKPSPPSYSYQTREVKAPHTLTDSVALRRAPNEREKGAPTDWLHTDSEITGLSERAEQTRRQDVQEGVPGFPNNQISSFKLFDELSNIVAELNCNAKDMFKPIESKIENEFVSKCNLSPNAQMIDSPKDCIVNSETPNFKVRRKLPPHLMRSDNSQLNRVARLGRKKVTVKSLGVRINSLTPIKADARVKHWLELTHTVILPAHTVSIAQTQINLGIRNKSVLVEEQEVSDGVKLPQGVFSLTPQGAVTITLVNETEDPVRVNSGTRWACQPLAASCHFLQTNELLQEPGLTSVQAQEVPESNPVTAPGMQGSTPGFTTDPHSGLPPEGWSPPSSFSSPPEPQTGIQELGSEDLEDMAHQLDKDPEFRRIWDELSLGNNTLLAANPKVLQKAKRLVWDYQDIFSTSAPGETDLIELSLKLKEGTEPIRQKSRPLNPAMEDNLQEQVKAWLDQGVIEPSDSPWCSPLVPVKKKDGTVRWAVDFRRVNACLEQDSYPLPRIQQLLEKAGGHQVYSALDATQAYFNIRIEPKSRKVTAFATPNGLYQFRRMPFGLSVSPAVYSRFIAVALNKLGTKSINTYLDDVLIFSNSLHQHVDRLRDTFEAHREAGVKLKPSKTLLFRERVEYLGHMLSQEGISMVDSYVDRIMEWPIPANIKELNTLLGFFSYYRAFIPGFAGLTAAMCSQRREKVLDWTPEMTSNFDKLKAEFRKYPVRAAPRFDSEEPFQLTTDYSSTAIGAVLSQVQDGQERLIAADGRKTTTPEKNYPSWKGELSAIIRGVRKFTPILSFKKFIINTDSKALVQLKSLKQCTGMLARWTEELAGFDFEVKHRPGKENTNADALSRSEHMPAATAEEEEEHNSYIGQLGQPGNTRYSQELERANILKEQAADPLLVEVRKWVVSGQPPDKLVVRGMSNPGQQYVRNFETLTLAPDGLLIMKVDTDFGTHTRILVPEKLKEPVFQMSHEHLSAGHFGTHATIARMRRNWWYPGLATGVATRVGVCHQCLAKIMKEKVKSGIHIPQMNGYPMQSLYIDLVGPLPESIPGNRYILSVEDGFSRFIQLYPLPSKHAAGVAKVLVNEVIKLFGCPMRIHSDNGKEFCAEVIEEMYKRLEIHHTRTPVYNPSSNPVERFHRTLNQMLRVLTARDDKEWEGHLSAITLAYNTKVNAVTGVTPSLAFLGREAKLPVDLVLHTPDPLFPSPHHGVEALLARYNLVYSYVQKGQEAVIRRNAKLYTGSAQFNKGDLVWYFSVRPPAPIQGERSKPAKHVNRWIGPWVIEDKISEVLYRIRPWDPNSKFKALVANVSKLHHMKGRPEQVSLPADWDPGEDSTDPLEEVSIGGGEASGTTLPIPVYDPSTMPETRPVSMGAGSIRDPDPLETPLPPAPPMTEAEGQTIEDTILGTPPPGGGNMEIETPLPGPSAPIRPDPMVRKTRSNSVKRGREMEEGEGEGSPTPRSKSQCRETEGEEYREREGEGVVPRRQGFFEKVARGVEDKVRTWTDTATLLGAEEDESMTCINHLGTVFTPLQVGMKPPQWVQRGGSFHCYAPGGCTIGKGKVQQVELKLLTTFSKDQGYTLYTPKHLSRQGCTIYPNFLSKQDKISVLLHNPTQVDVEIKDGQSLCKGSFWRPSDYKCNIVSSDSGTKDQRVHCQLY